MNRKVLQALLVLFTSGCASAALRSVPSEKPIQLLLVNDVYVGEPNRDGLGGVSRLAALKKELSATGTTKLFLAGDFLFPSLLSKWYKGSQIVEYFNAAGLDFATYGNHEFDDSRQVLIDRVRQSHFKWTSANCMGADGNPIPGVTPWDTITISGVKFGFFGVTLPGGYPRWVNCSNPDSAAHAVIPKLKTAGAEVIVALTHQSRLADSTLLANELAIDFILGGHEHTVLEVEIGNRFIVKADKNAQSAQMVTLTRSGNTLIRAHRLVQLDSNIAEDPVTKSVVGRWQDSLVKRLGPEEKIATSAVPLDVTDTPVRRRETTFGNFVADAMRSGTGADVAVTIGGAMRYDDVIPAGQVTNRQIESIFLFPDETRVVTFWITGSRLRELLEHSVSRGGLQWGGYLQVSGVQFSWNTELPVGSRIVGNILRENGALIMPEDRIKLSINAYTACDSGDGYSIPESADACTRRESSPRAAQLVIDYMRAAGKVALPAVGRVTPLR